MPRTFTVFTSQPLLTDGMDANGTTIGNLPAPGSDNDAARKSYVDAKGVGAVVRNLDGADPTPAMGTLAFKLNYDSGQPTSGSITFVIPFAGGGVDLEIPATLPDDAALADILDILLPDQYQTVFGIGADTFAEGRTMVIVFLTGHDHLPLDLVSPLAQMANTLSGGTPAVDVLTIEDTEQPGLEGVVAQLGQEVIDVQGEKVWKKMNSGFVQIYPVIA